MGSDFRLGATPNESHEDDHELDRSTKNISCNACAGKRAKSRQNLAILWEFFCGRRVILPHPCWLSPGRARLYRPNVKTRELLHNSPRPVLVFLALAQATPPLAEFF